MTRSAETPAAAPPNSLVGVGLLALWLASGAALEAGYAPGPLTFVFILLGWVLSVAAHEFSHAAVAWLGGDHTIAAKGYLSFDPRRYGDLGTTLVIPLLALAMGGIGFPGGAVFLRNDLMRSRAWRAAASLAGPAATLAVLLVLAAVLALWSQSGALGPCFDALAFLAFLQATALVLNLLPIPGLDGFNALRPFLPRAWGKAIRKIEGIAMIGLLLVLFLTPGAGDSLFRTASSLTGALGVPLSALVRGYQAFHFWR